MEKHLISPVSDISASRLEPDKYLKNFSDIKYPLTHDQAAIESDRCYFCYDAPCTTACPTDIDIPNFIRKIKTKNTNGAALEILNKNIFGGTCARVCPVEILCEQACVRVKQEEKPVAIGKLQRYATDAFFSKNIQPFLRKSSTGHRIAVVGAGPAGLSCAHALSCEGHDVVVFDEKEKAGGLNEYGLAAYKMVDDFAQKEIDFILSLGGIQINNSQKLGTDISLDELRSKFDAVFLSVGLTGVNNLGLEKEHAKNIYDAIDYIAQIRQATNLNNLPVGRKVIVIGGGNTAIDIASQIKRLGAEDVTLVYRRGPEEMGATSHEQEIVQTDGVKIKFWAVPKKFHINDDFVHSVEFAYTKADPNGKLIKTEETFTLEADMVFKAIGQNLKIPSIENLKIENGRIVVNENQETSLPGVYAGGDCTNQGEDLTVHAVRQGKIAAAQMNHFLKNKGA